MRPDRELDGEILGPDRGAPGRAAGPDREAQRRGAGPDREAQRRGAGPDREAQRRGAGPDLTVGQVGEFPLIERLAARLGPARADVVVGIGDDVAVLAIAPDRYLLATCDVQVAGVHFLPHACDPYRLGRKAAAINLSDIAAVGGWPTHMLVSLALPADTPVSFVEALYDGIWEEAARYGADVVGGNVSRSARFMVDVTLLGEVEPQHLMCRNGARPGDRILVTGRVGASAAGLTLLATSSLQVDEADREAVLAAHQTPTPRLKEARVIAASGDATAMIDVSDGLAADLGHICDASAVGALLRADALPVDDATRRVAHAAGRDPLEWALTGGEDYELLFAAPSGAVDAIRDAVLQATATPVAVVGEVLPVSAGRILLLPDGRRIPLGDHHGWKHF